MTTSLQLATGLSGVLGSHYVQSTNQLYFVEFNGQLSVLDLIRQLDHVVFSGTAVMPADSALNLINGTSAQGGHMGWDHVSPTHSRVMRPFGNCDIAYIGLVDFDAITHAELQNLDYARTSLNGADGPGNQLATNSVFAIRNDSIQPGSNFDYAKVQVLQYGADIKVRWVTYLLKPRLRVIGTGYTEPEDVVVTRDGSRAYITERTPGNLLRVGLPTGLPGGPPNANRAAATVVASGMTAPCQVALDEDHMQAYVVESASPGPCRLWRVDLTTTGAKTAVASGLDTAVGLVISDDARYAYVTQQMGGVNRIRRLDLVTGAREVLAPTLTAPFFLSWADENRSTILIPEQSPANRVSALDLTRTPQTTVVAASGLAASPRSVNTTSANRLLVCSDHEIVQVDLTGSVYGSAGPMLLGVGHVPKTKIGSDGYATTDAGYFFKVKDAPFGGTLPIMFNHEKARSLGGQWYQILLDNVPQAQAFSDYKWNNAHLQFELATNPQSGNFQRVRQAGDLWYNYWLGYFLDTSSLTNGAHTIAVKLFSAPNPGAEIAAGADSLVVRIDNSWPRAAIEQIVYHDPANTDPLQRHRVVDACAIVQGSTSDEFSFFIDATDPEGHLLSWSLGVLWGDNKSATIAGDSYEPSHVPAPPSRLWAGVHGEVPTPHWHATVHTDPANPSSAIDPTSRRCAHTFTLSVWDRAINGWGYIHNSGYHKSITLLLS